MRCSTYPSSSSDVFKYFASVNRTPSALVFVSRSLPAKSHLKQSTKQKLVVPLQVGKSLFSYFRQPVPLYLFVTNLFNSNVFLWGE